MSQLKVNSISDSAGANGNAITLSSDGTCTVKATNKSNRNLVINGAMQVAQRGTSSTGVGYVTVDRFSVEYGGENEAPTCSQHALTSSDTGPWAKGFRNSLHITNGNQTGGAGVTDEMNIDYRFEAQDIANSGWNYTSASSYITLSFWVKSSVAQDFKFYLKTEDGTEKGYPMSTGALSANTWTKITKTIPGHADLTFDNNNAKGLNIEWFAFLGTDRTGSVTDNAWMNYSGSTRVNDMTSTWWTTNDATFEITGVQLEVGDTATEFEHRSYEEELQRCYRYYEQFSSQAQSEAVFGSGYFESNARGRHCIRFNRKRATPTITATAASTFMNLNTNSVPAGDTITIKKPTVTSAEFQLEAGSGANDGTDGQGCCLASKDSTEATIKISAEL